MQSNVLLWVLYYVAFVPLALVRRPFDDPLNAKASAAPRWRSRSPGPQDPSAARRQF